MNTYEQRQEEKRERYEARADKARVEADHRFKAGDLREESSGIPLGQPILIGHHSQRRHENAIKRANNNVRKSMEATKKAEHYDRKAAGVGKGGISSDDPEAITKLNDTIAKCEVKREEYKKVNKLIRKKGSTAESVAVEMGWKLITVQKILEPDFAGRIGIPSYVITNLGANIRRMKKRVAALRVESQLAEAPEIQGEGFRIEENKEDNRIRIHTDSKPSKEIRTQLKRAGFRWSPTNQAWQRQLNNTGRYFAQQMIKILRDTQGVER